MVKLDSIFKPISKHEARLEDPIERYLTTVFCYGCNLGPVQTARSLGNMDRRQISWVNQRHITTENLDQAIQFIINSYNKFGLPKYWGDGKSASADGTIWALYEQNLLSERHIRYGGYGELAIIMFLIITLHYLVILYRVVYGKDFIY